MISFFRGPLRGARDASLGRPRMSRAVATFARLQTAQAAAAAAADPVASPMFDNQKPKFRSEPLEDFWRKVPIWQDVSAADFMSYRWSVSNRLPFPVDAFSVSG